MGQASSSTLEKPNPKTAATLYYFAGRGVADQIRWMLAATNTSFVQVSITSRAQFLRMAERQLPFGQLPLLQIDGLELVQSQAIIQYLAQRGGLFPEDSAERIKCLMISETIKDLIGAVTSAPFHRYRSLPDGALYKTILADKWNFLGARFEIILKENGGKFLVGSKLSFVDILMAHLLTWFVEECGSEVVQAQPYLVNLQCTVLEIESIKTFIRSPNYFPVGDNNYCQQVSQVLGRAA